MIEIRESDVFARWFAGLRDHVGRTRILVRIRRLSLGNPGDVRSVGQGVAEIRMDVGPGYRVYLQRKGSTVIILLCGGDNSTQAKDIKTAKRLAKEWSE